MKGSGSTPSRPGRPRDRSLDLAILESAQHQLAVHGYEGMSLSAVAAEAETTRQAIYRRFRNKADLATAAIAALSEAAPRAATEDPFEDLVKELEAFRKGVSRPRGISLVGVMLQEGADPELRELFRTRVVEPRRAKLGAILSRAAQAGLLDRDADLEIATSFLTGSYYALALAGRRIGRDWPHRIATAAWRSLGGRPPG